MASNKTLDVAVNADHVERFRPDGLAVRRRRHDRGWSPRELVAAIAQASFNSSGLRQTLTPNQLLGIEEQAELVTYDQLLLLADGLNCDPVDLIAAGELSSRRSPKKRMN